MTIQLLEDNLVNKIAAGEVIERPASIVKELAENAIDAGSSKIAVSVLEGGIQSIEVEDDGNGIPDQELALAFERHATSKLMQEEDLVTIQTMGFRGEALPSIASVSKMEFFTRAQGHKGMRAIVEAGTMADIGEFPVPFGSRVVVNEIFFNTPVRRKFLKSPVSENNAIYDTISKLALSRPDIAFSFSNEKKIYFKTPGNGKLLDTMISIYGKDFSSQFDLLEWEGMRTAVSGVISRPEFKRMNRKNQVIFVNQRLIKSPMISRAIDEGYRGLLLSREYPAVILHIQMDGNDVDINVHPQKTEVRFREESTIFKVVKESIRSTLEHNNYRMELDNLKTLTSYSSPTSNFHFTQQERSFVRDPSPGYHEQQFSFEQRPEETLTESLQSIALPEEPSVVSSINQFRIIGQCFNTYILLEKEGSLFLIDQHAAHERILFNRFYKHTERLADDSQLLAFPQTYDLSVARIDLLEKHMDLLSKVGIQVELLGPDSIVVRSAPARLRGEEIEAVNELLDLLEEDHADAFMHNAVAVMACKQAIKAGQTLTLKEMETIITELFQTEDYKNCPHGRPTILELTRNELDKSFKR